MFYTRNLSGVYGAYINTVREETNHKKDQKDYNKNDFNVKNTNREIFKPNKFIQKSMTKYKHFNIIYSQC